MNDDDIKNGDRLSFVIGDTYIDYERMSPQVQWQTIALALRAHGLRIANNSLTVSPDAKREANTCGGTGSP